MFLIGPPIIVYIDVKIAELWQAALRPAMASNGSSAPDPQQRKPVDNNNCSSARICSITTQPLLRGTRESVTRHVTCDMFSSWGLGAPRDTVFRAVMGGGDIGYGRIFVELYGCTPVTLSYAHFTCHKSHKSVTSRTRCSLPGRGTVCPAASVQGAASCSLMVY